MVRQGGARAMPTNAMDAASLAIDKYPRTPHLVGSRLQDGDDAAAQVPYSAIVGRNIVVEEKMDGANSGVSFTAGLDLLCQSRGHYLSGGPREKHFRPLLQWADAHFDALADALQDRFLMYGEWMYAKHTVFYDRLVHLFLEFDVFDRSTQAFLSTPARRELLRDAPVVSVPVLYEGPAPRDFRDLARMIQPSLAKSPRWRETLCREAQQRGLDAARVLEQTEDSDLAEGLYIKLEEGDETVGRLKLVREDFIQTIVENTSHWHSRPIVPNGMAAGVDLFAPRPTVAWEDLRGGPAPSRASSERVRGAA